MGEKIRGGVNVDFKVRHGAGCERIVMMMMMVWALRHHTRGYTKGSEAVWLACLATPKPLGTWNILDSVEELWPGQGLIGPTGPIAPSHPSGKLDGVGCEGPHVSRKPAATDRRGDRGGRVTQCSAEMNVIITDCPMIV